MCTLLTSVCVCLQHYEYSTSGHKGPTYQLVLDGWGLLDTIRLTRYTFNRKVGAVCVWCEQCREGTCSNHGLIAETEAAGSRDSQSSQYQLF